MLNRRLFRLAVPLAVGALALTACGDDNDNGDSGNGDSKKTYTIAFQGPLSGDNAAIGENEANGVELAVTQANEKGDLPFTLKYAEQDDLGTPEGSPPAARKSIDDPEVIAVIGPAFSGATKAAGKLFAAANLAAVSPSATNPDLTSAGYSTFFRVVPPDSAQGSEGANYLAKGLKAKSVYSINDKSEYGVGLSGVLDKSLKDAGVKVTSEGVPITKDYSTVAQKVKNANPDAVFYSGYFPEFALVTKALRGVGYTKPLMSGDGSKEDEYIKQATPKVAEGAYLLCPCGDANVDPNAKDFADAYKAKFGKPAGTYSPESFDAANAVIAAMKTLGDNITREGVVTALKSIDYKGLTKQVKFDAKGEVQTKTVFVYQVKDGKLGILGTTLELSK
ncbi:MAG TPA: branched-chain amino acid ABC transporter substrate-binding protein [Mycobacteriales bacterium]|nr:branched-chain amino acid ABC transporter substrate-binding protein [Mycobacteriales bacterium]